MVKLLIVIAASFACTIGAPQVKIDDRLDWRVVGGADARVGQFPYQISLRVNGEHHCGGSIISNRWILTAAHCFNEVFNSTLTVVIGTTTLNAGGDKYKVERVVIHEKWDYQTVHTMTVNDIALLKTSNDINLGNNIGTIKIGMDNIEGGVEVVLSGWGRTSYPGHFSNKLQFLITKTLSLDECKENGSPIMPSVLDTHLCTLTKAGEGACHGDSGGPLTKGGELVGIVSFGHPCARGYPDVFTRVSSYLDWIQHNAK